MLMVGAVGCVERKIEEAGFVVFYGKGGWVDDGDGDGDGFGGEGEESGDVEVVG